MDAQCLYQAVFALKHLIWANFAHDIYLKSLKTSMMECVMAVVFC